MTCSVINALVVFECRATLGQCNIYSIPSFGGGGLKGISAVGMIMFVALIPFFAFKEIGRVIGERELYSLIFTRGTKKGTLQSRVRQHEDG